MGDISFNQPRNVALNPPTTIAADGKTTLSRFRVDAIIYAPNKREAQRRLNLANIYLDAARITDTL